jgi:hypothetical protein
LVDRQRRRLVYAVAADKGAAGPTLAAGAVATNGELAVRAASTAGGGLRVADGRGWSAALGHSIYSPCPGGWPCWPYEGHVHGFD